MATLKSIPYRAIEQALAQQKDIFQDQSAFNTAFHKREEIESATIVAALRTRHPAMDPAGALAQPYHGFSRAPGGRRPSHSTSRVLSCPANPR